MAKAPAPVGSPHLERANNRLWLNSPLLLPSFGKIRFTIYVAVGIYVPVLAVSAALGFGRTYLSSPAFVLGAVGTGWVGGSIRARARTVDQLYDDLATAFGIPRSWYVGLVRKHFERICDWRGHLLSAATLFSVVIVAACVSFFVYPVTILGGVQVSLRPWAFSPAWYSDEHLYVKFAITLYFAVWVSLALGASVWMFAQELLLLKDLSILPVPPVPESLRAQLRLLADWHVSVAIDWSLGAILFVLMFLKSPDYFSILTISMLIVAGSAILIYPQVLFARVVRNAHERSCRIAIAVYARSRRTTRRISDERRLEILMGIAEISARPRFWVYSADEVMRWGLAQAVAFAALAAQIYSNRRSG